VQETRSIPIVFAIAVDPVGSGFVANFNHPGGNVTGFTNSAAHFSLPRLFRARRAIVVRSFAVRQLSARLDLCRPGEISSAHWSFATISLGRRWAAGGRADAHYQRRHTSGGTSTQMQFYLSARMLVRGYGGFYVDRGYRLGDCCCDLLVGFRECTSRLTVGNYCSGCSAVHRWWTCRTVFTRPSGRIFPKLRAWPGASMPTCV
jgi:hypothetical protein